MRVGLQTWGTEGDVRPFIALASGLVSSGHTVSVSVTEIMNGSYSRYGEEFGFPVIHPGRVKVSPEEFSSLGRRFVASRNPALKSRLLVENFLDPCLDDMYDTALEMCRESDLVIGHLFAYSLRAAALKTGTPWIALYTTPLIPCGSIAAPGFPSRFHRLGWRCFGIALDLLWKPGIDRFFRRWGLPVPESVFQGVFHSEHLNLVSTSPVLYPGEGIPGYDLCGFLEIPPDDHASLPGPLDEFISSGDPPVFVTFGSMLHGERRPLDVVEIVLEAARQVGCRTVIQAEGSVTDPEREFFTGRVPHRLLLPRCSLAVHHGGCGTSHAACAAGVPSVVVEYTSDQPMWGMILKKAGVAPGVLHRRSLNPRKLAGSVGRALKDPQYRERALSVADGMKKENGVEKALRLIEEKFGE